MNRIEIGIFGDTICSKFPQVSYFNYIHNFSERSIPHIDGIYEFYKEDQLKFKIPIQHAGKDTILNRWVERNGGTLVSVNGILFSDLSNMGHVKCEAFDYHAEAVNDSNIKTFVEAYVLGFAADMNNFENIYTNMRLLVTIPGVRLYIIKLESEVVGIGVIYQKNKIVFLAGGATKKEYRKKGAHAYSIRYRIIEAIKRRSECIVSWAPVNHDSYHNMRRAGLEHIYTCHVYMMNSMR